MLPNVALLRIFDFYIMNEDREDEYRIQAWQTLVHVCRSWRIIVFDSPRRLNLRLLCTVWTPVRKILDTWPPLPIVVRTMDENLAVLLEHSNRICQFNLDFRFSSLQWEIFLSAIRKPFPALTGFKLCPVDEIDEMAPVDPDSFLGGSAPQLKTLQLHRVPFPGLPKLLLSATHLVYLELWEIPHSGYISPEAMVTCLSTLTRLETLEIGFEAPQSRPDRNSQRPPPYTQTPLPALTKFWFQGASEYVEDLVARIDTPLLDDLTLTFIHPPIFSSPQLIQFIDRTPKIRAHDQARVVFEPDEDVWITIPQAFGGKLRLQITCSRSNQLLYLTQLCSLSIPQALISAVEHLCIVEGASLCFDSDIEKSSVQWLEFLRPFTAVKCLYLSREYTSHLVLALQELVGGRVTEVLPSLQTLFLEESEDGEETPSLGPVQEAIGQFVAARQLVGQPIAFSLWNGLKDVCDEIDGLKEMYESNEMED